MKTTIDVLPTDRKNSVLSTATWCGTVLVHYIQPYQKEARRGRQKMLDNHGSANHIIKA
jgi:hypothetical protein